MAEGRGGPPDEVISSDNDNEDWIAGQARNDNEGADEDFSVQPPRQATPDTPPWEWNSKDWIAGQARNDNADSNDISKHFSEKVGSPLASEEDGIHTLAADAYANDFPSLQTAITNVDAGGTIHVTADITMTGVLDINKSINFVSDGDGGPFSLFVSGNFRHFNLIGGTGITVDFGDLTLTRHPDLKNPITDLDPENKTLGLGGGLFIISGEVTLAGGTIDGNRTLGFSGGIYVDTDSTFNMCGGTISNNISVAKDGYFGGGGGIFIDSGNFNMSAGIIEKNSVINTAGTFRGGGCLILNEGCFNFSGGTISGNSADLGGGICVAGNDSRSISTDFNMSGDAKLVNNIASWGGGGLCVWGDWKNPSRVTIEERCIIEGNEAPSGGGIALLGAVCHMTGGIIRDNTAGSGGGVYLDAINYWFFAEFYMSGDAIITGNTANVGEAGGIMSPFTTAYLSGNASITNNTAATYGGGVFGSVNISGDASVSGNIAGIDGGGICLIAPDEFISVILGIDSYTAELSDNASITNNTALRDGGGVFTEDYSKVTATEDVIFSGNKAATGWYITNETDKATHDDNILTRSFSSPFDRLANYPADTNHVYGYNNYDINYKSGVEASALEITKEKASGQAAAVKVGDSVKYKITIKNTGAIALTDVLVTESMTGVWSNPSADLYTALGSAIPTGDDFTIPSLPASASWTIDYTVEATATGTLENLVTARDGNGTGSNEAEDDDATVTVTAKEFYTVVYFGNNHTRGAAPLDIKGNAPAGSNKYYKGSNVTILPQGLLAKEGYTFSSWNTKADGTGDKYAAGAIHANITANVSLYAQWLKDTPPADPPNPPADPPTPPEDPPEEPPLLPIPPQVDPPVPPTPPVEPPTIPRNEPVVIPLRPTVDPPSVSPEPPETSPQADIDEPKEPESPTGTDISMKSGEGFSEADNEKLAKQTGNFFSDVFNGRVPLGNLFGRGAWSLLSLIMSLIAVLVSLLLILGAIFRRIYRNEDEDKEVYADSDADDEDEKKKKFSKVLKVATIVLGILTPIVWLILDDLTLPMVWINKWTLYVGIVFLVHIVFLIVYKARRHREDSDDDEKETTYDNAIGA